MITRARRLSKSNARQAKSTASNRLVVVCGIVLYVATFQWMYINYLYPVWAYFGFEYFPPPTTFLVLAWILSVMPSLWMPIQLRRPSQLIYWVLYIAVIIPSMFVPLYAGLNTPLEVSYLMLALFVGFAITGVSYWLPLWRVDRSKLSGGIFWKIVAGITAVLTIWMLVVFRHNLHIVSFMDVYDLRDASSEIAEGTQVNMAFMALTGALNPLMMAHGLFYKRRGIFLVGAIGQLLVYSVGGTKGSILSILFVPGFCFLLKFGKKPFGLKLLFAALLVVGTACLSDAFVDLDPGPLHGIILFVVLMRTFSINGLVSAQYFDFFQHNPHTYLSHVKGFSWFVQYPYKYPVGQEIGVAYAGTTGLDATAHFWATDGIGGFGLPGIIFISVFCAAVFWIFDSASQRHDPRFAALVITYAAYNIANISLFTSLLSGGLILLIFLLYIKPVEKIPSDAVSLKKPRTHVPIISPAF